LHGFVAHQFTYQVLPEYLSTSKTGFFLSKTKKTETRQLLLTSNNSAIKTEASEEDKVLTGALKGLIESFQQDNFNTLVEPASPFYISNKFLP
jgi:hypothetical protein